MAKAQAEVGYLDFPDNVRKRKEMYLPNKDHAVYEIVDNSIDEALAGNADAIAVAIIEDVVVVEDNGSGIPVKPHKHPKFNGLSQAEVAYTTLHAGGKFGEAEGYKNATGGLHGVGASVVNALSEQLTLCSKSEGKKYQIEFSKGHTTKGLHLVEEGLEDTDTGTEVKFKLDPEIWEDEKFDLKRIKKRIQQLSYLNPGLTMYLYLDSDDKDGKRIKEENTYCYPEGIKAYVEKLVKSKTTITEIIGMTTKVDIEEMEVSISLAYTEAYSDETYTFCNNISTENGGDHLTGFRTGLAKAINDYAVSNSFIKEDAKFESEDTREGLVAIVSIKVKEPKFDGQGKAKITMPKIRNAVKTITEEFMMDYLDKNPEVAKVIVNKAMSASNARKAAQKARESARKQKDLIEGGTPAGLADCSEKDPALCSIFIVEGDSAGGSAKQGRDRKTQAVLPIFGKILNVEKSRLHKILSNDKLKMLLRALKCGIAEEFDINKLRYHKIIIMSDADKLMSA